MEQAKANKSLTIFLALAITAFAALPSKADQRISADSAGPSLKNPFSIPGLTAYNKAIALYGAGKFDAALGEIRTAIRSRELTGRNLGFGFANLCLMYLHEREWKQAFAACVKAKRLLPGYGPVLTNIRRIKSRTPID